jgi:hypothetical protein
VNPAIVDEPIIGIVAVEELALVVELIDMVEDLMALVLYRNHNGLGLLQHTLNGGGYFVFIT